MIVSVPVVWASMGSWSLLIPHESLGQRAWSDSDEQTRIQKIVDTRTKESQLTILVVVDLVDIAADPHIVVDRIAVVHIPED